MDKIQILFEDDYLIIFDKLSGWVVNESQTTKYSLVVQKYIKNKFDFPLAKDNEYRSGIVHRLDKPTSGALIVAKDKETFSLMQKLFKERKIKKKYLALVHNIIFPEKGIVNAPVGRLSWNKKKFGIMPGGRDSETSYQVVEKYKKEKDSFCLVELYPKTGRTHQIRIHMKYIGHPILCDQFYAGRKTYKNDSLWCKRLFLHASEISFTHPRNKKNMIIKSKLPADLKECLLSLEKVN